MLDSDNPLDFVAANTNYKSTDLIAKGTWLIPTSVLELLNNTYTDTVMRLLGWSETLGLYVGESALANLANGGDPSKHGFVYWEAKELAQELDNNWWTRLTENQVTMIFGYVDSMKRLNRQFAIGQKILKGIGDSVPPGWEWVMHKPPTQTMVLARIGQNLDQGNFLGAYQPQNNSLRWDVYKLAKVPNPDYNLVLAKREITSEIQARALIITMLKFLDPNKKIWWTDDTAKQ